MCLNREFSVYVSSSAATGGGCQKQECRPTGPALPAGSLPSRSSLKRGGGCPRAGARKTFCPLADVSSGGLPPSGVVQSWGLCYSFRPLLVGTPSVEREGCGQTPASIYRPGAAGVGAAPFLWQLSGGADVRSMVRAWHPVPASMGELSVQSLGFRPGWVT